MHKTQFCLRYDKGVSRTIPGYLIRNLSQIVQVLLGCIVPSAAPDPVRSSARGAAVNTLRPPQRAAIRNSEIKCIGCDSQLLCWARSHPNSHSGPAGLQPCRHHQCTVGSSGETIILNKCLILKFGQCCVNCRFDRIAFEFHTLNSATMHLFY